MGHSFLQKVKYFLFNKEKRMTFLAQHGFYNGMSDEDFLKKQFKNVFGYELNLENPKTFNEKLQWIKLNDRQDEYTMLVDKFSVKSYVSKMIGEEYIIKTLGVWDSFDDIDFDKLPNQFVLKCTHDSGGLVICKDKQKLNIKAIRKKINSCLARNYYLQNREWPYKNITPRIIAEPYLEDQKTGELRDFKFFAFNGVVKALYIAKDRMNDQKETKFDFFDSEFNHLSIINTHPNAQMIPEKPQNFELMKKLAETLSSGIPHVRVDFYEVNGKVYFGEMTFFHNSGFIPFEPKEWDLVFGEWLELPIQNSDQASEVSL